MRAAPRSPCSRQPPEQQQRSSLLWPAPTSKEYPMSDIVYLVLAAVAVSLFGYACHALAKHLAEKDAGSRGARIINVIGDVADHIGAALKAAPQISGNPAIISAAVQAGVGQVSARIPDVLAKAGVHDSVIQTT